MSSDFVMQIFWKPTCLSTPGNQQTLGLKACAAMQMHFAHVALRLETERRLVEDRSQILGPTVMAVA